MVEDLWVRYRTTLEKRPTLKRALARLGRRERQVRVVEALRGVSFSVSRGTAFGIVGANGAGKSTLLRTIAGILPPSEGRVTVRGRVSTLLALGVGFNKELTGRDNVLLGGMAAGLEAAEVRTRFDDIEAFADLGEFIDYPMRSYSSGMYGRLGFAVAAHLEPDVLLIDEALSTGDAAFREKCMDKMRELCGQDRTILLVSHGLGHVADLATECLWLDRGTIRGLGPPQEVIDAYTHFLKVRKRAAAYEDV
ncbi:MAG: ABC transporter ATP-binding protein [Actinomycetota bacterium]|nr:ABC transporter ATP-binding protein [Actinomycetota bacterium]